MSFEKLLKNYGRIKKGFCLKKLITAEFQRWSQLSIFILFVAESDGQSVLHSYKISGYVIFSRE